MTGFALMGHPLGCFAVDKLAIWRETPVKVSFAPNWPALTIWYPWILKEARNLDGPCPFTKR